MAGGKATPRQKMINMMYLVLTALLALNVSAEILESFQNIADSLRESSAKFSAKNASFAGDIENSIKKEMESGKKTNEKYLKEMEVIEKKTNDVIVYLDTLVSRLYAIVGASDETAELPLDQRRLKNPGETEKNYTLWMIGDGKETDNDGRGAGEALKLHKTLDEYVDWANSWYKEHAPGQKDNSEKKFQYIAVDPKDNKYIVNPETKDKTWEYYTFHGAPAVANIAMIQKWKNDVNIIESDLLEVVKSRLNEVVFKIDSLKPIIAAESKVVVAGFPYKAKIYVVAIAEQDVPPVFTGPGVKRDPGGNSATVDLIADASVVPKGKSEGIQAFSVTVDVKKADGTSQRTTLNEKFTVRMPEIQVRSGAVQILYYQCKNPLDVDCPALGEFYSPTFQATSGAQTIPEPAKYRGRVNVIPVSDQPVQLKVFQPIAGQTRQIGFADFTVIRPPKPTLGFFSNGKEVIASQFLNRTDPLQIVVKSNPEFFKALPEDAKYVFTQVIVEAKTGLGGYKKIAEYPASSTGETAMLQVPLSSLLGGSIYEPGMTLFVTIGKVARVNYAGQQVVETQFSKTELQKALNIK